MVQTNEASLVCHAPEAEPVRPAVAVARTHRPTVEAQAVSVDTRNAAAPVVPVRAGAVECAIEVAAAAGGGQEEGGWGGGAVGANFDAARAVGCH